MSSNPYIAGPPVCGEDFYGREEDVQKVLSSSHKLVLFIATRRMGKTSLCYQIKHKCESESSLGSNLCLDWNLQGKRDIPSAKRRFLYFSNKRTLKHIKDDQWGMLENIQTCHEVIEAICEIYLGLPDKRNIILLLDEPDIFLHFAENKEYDFLTDLKNTFESIPNLRVVIVSPPRIMNLFQHLEIPCLLDNFQIYYLNEFNDTEAEDLIQLRKRKEFDLKFLSNGNKVINDIIEVSNRVPFYIQQICGNIFEEFPKRNPSQVMEDIIEQQVFSPYFTSDFNELHPIQKIMLLNLVNSQEFQESQVLIDEVKNIKAEIEGQIPTLKYIDELVNLGILKKFEGNKFHFSNRLFDRWILRDFDNLWNQTMNKIGSEKKFEKKILVPESLKKKDLAEMEAEFEAFKEALRMLDKDHRNGTVADDFYFKRRISLVKDKALLIKKLKDHLSSLGAHSLTEVLESVEQEEGEDIIRQKLQEAEKEGKTKGWSDIITSLEKNAAVSKTQAAIEAAFKVAEYLIQSYI